MNDFDRIDRIAAQHVSISSVLVLVAFVLCLGIITGAAMLFVNLLMDKPLLMPARIALGCFLLTIPVAVLSGINLWVCQWRLDRV